MAAKLISWQPLVHTIRPFPRPLPVARCPLPRTHPLRRPLTTPAPTLPQQHIHTCLHTRSSCAIPRTVVETLLSVRAILWLSPWHVQGVCMQVVPEASSNQREQQHRRGGGRPLGARKRSVQRSSPALHSAREVRRAGQRRRVTASAAKRADGLLPPQPPATQSLSSDSAFTPLQRLVRAPRTASGARPRLASRSAALLAIHRTTSKP